MSIDGYASFTPRILASYIRRTYGLVMGFIYAIAAAALVCLMVLITSDVVLRNLFNLPILGSVELTEFFMLALVFFGMVYTQVKKGHISIDVLTSRLSPRTQAVIKSITHLATFGVFFVISWQSVIRAGILKTGTYISAVWHIPNYPFVYIAVVSAAIICVLILIELVAYLRQVIEGAKWQSSTGLLSLIVLVSVALAIPLWGQALFLQVNPLLTGAIFTVFMIIILFSDMSVGIVMALVGFMGTMFLRGTQPGLVIMGSIPNYTAASYGNSVIPLFILMGAFCFHSGISKDLYETTYKLFGRLPGGLAMATVGACAAFGAVSGSSGAVSATMGVVAMPEMKKYKYDSALSAGCISAGGTLGILIPPSIPLAIYGLLTEQSIGKLFIAGVIPGILEAVLYMVTIYILCKRNPLKAPPAPSESLKEKFTSMKKTWSVVLLFIMVMGGLYIGIFTPTEAAGVGAFAALVIALARRKLGWKGFNASLAETGKTTGMVFILIIGGTIYGHFLSVTRLPFEIAELVGGMAINRYLILGLIILVYLILGCIMSSLAMIIITVPIFFPVITVLGFDPIWFGILIVVLVEIGAITPPVGINLFILKGVASDIPMFTVVRGIAPFLIADLAFMGFLILVPQVVLFLPGLMY